MGVAGPTIGNSWEPCIRSPTVRSMAPSLPPGCSTRKSGGPWKPRRSSSATASASPSASCRVVEVVGAFSASAASGASGMASTMSAARPSALSATTVMAISGIWKRAA